MKLLKMSNFTFFHNFFYAIYILKSFNSHISVVISSFFEFGTVSKWCIRGWVKSKCISTPTPVLWPFSNLLVIDLHNKGVGRRRVLSCLTLSQTSPGFSCLQYKSFENTVGKREIARNEQFLLFPQCFLPIWKLSAIFIKTETVVCKLFQFGRD